MTTEEIDEDAFVRSFHGIPLQHELEAKTDIELAELHARLQTDLAGVVIVENEWRRREKIEQHKLNEIIIARQHQLNLEITKIQHRNNRMTAMLSALIGLAGVFIGAWIKSPERNIQQPPPQQTATQIPSGHATAPQLLSHQVPWQDIQPDKKEKTNDDTFQPPVR